MKVPTIWLWAGVVGLACLSALGQVLMRLGGRDVAERSMTLLLSRPVWAAGLVLGWMCGLAWSVIVTRVPLGIAWPVFMGVSFAVLTTLTYFWLGEPLVARQWIGITLIFGGILLVTRG